MNTNIHQNHHLLKGIKLGSQFLDSQQDKELLFAINSIDKYVLSPKCRIAVFGSFNQGKSTLLNALLGIKILPADLIPTTGATINLEYGEDLKTRIVLLNGTEINEKGTEVIEKFTRLDGERKMRSDVDYVDVYIPHPLLKSGITLVDLPGTNDQEEQDNLIRHQLLTADLIIQVLDAGKLFTLREVEDLQYWLLNQGINNVIFVVNFANLLEIEEQIKVMQRARYLAEEFKGEIFSSIGINNLYRVDALPALKAKHKGDYNKAFNSGILYFESALQKIAKFLVPKLENNRLSRLIAITQRLSQSLQPKITKLEAELTALIYSHDYEVQKIKNRIEYLQTKFQKSCLELVNLLSIQNLKSNYKQAIILALKEDKFENWEQEIFQKSLEIYLEIIQQSVQEASYILSKNQSQNLSISLPADPIVNLPQTPDIATPRTARSVTIASVVGVGLLGPIGIPLFGGITHYFNEEHKKAQEQLLNQFYTQVETAYNDAANDYLNSVSNTVISQIEFYYREVENIFFFNGVNDSSEIVNKRNELEQLKNVFKKLNTDL